MSVSVPGGPDGIEGSDGQRLADPLTTHFTVAPMTHAARPAAAGHASATSPRPSPRPIPPSVAPDEAATAQVGSFAWRWATMPSYFMSLWSPGEPNTITQGAVMAFESQEHMTTDGLAGPKVWQALLQAAATDQVDSYGHYDWVDVSESIPEHANVWRDGQIAYSTRANTGIAAAPTEQGTWPVYVRYVSTTMQGTNPDGIQVRGPGCALGQLLPRRRRAARLQPPRLRLPPEPRVRGDATLTRRGGLPLHTDRHPRHRRVVLRRLEETSTVEPSRAAGLGRRGRGELRARVAP